MKSPAPGPESVPRPAGPLTQDLLRHDLRAMSHATAPMINVTAMR